MRNIFIRLTLALKMPFLRLIWICNCCIIQMRLYDDDDDDDDGDELQNQLQTL
jgi:hypothetical protein